MAEYRLAWQRSESIDYRDNQSMGCQCRAIGSRKEDGRSGFGSIDETQ